MAGAPSSARLDQRLQEDTLTDEKQNVAPIWLDGRYVLPARIGLIEIVPSGPKRRHRMRWWRAVGPDGPVTNWLPSPRAVAAVLLHRGL